MLSLGFARINRPLFKVFEMPFCFWSSFMASPNSVASSISVILDKLGKIKEAANMSIPSNAAETTTVNTTAVGLPEKRRAH